MSVGDSTGRKIFPHNAMQFVSVLERCRCREYREERTGFDQVSGWTRSEFWRPHIVGYAIGRECLFRILADRDRNRMNVSVLADSIVEVQIGTHEDAGCTNSSGGKHDSFRGFNDELPFSGSCFVIDKMRMYLANLIAATHQTIDFCVGVDVSAQCDSVREPLHEATHLPIVRAPHTATAALAALVRIVW